MHAPVCTTPLCPNIYVHARAHKHAGEVFRQVALALLQQGERERADAEGIWLWALSPPPLLLGESAIPAAAAALNGRFIKKIRRLTLVLLGL
jgi:hypothetical protein